MRNFLVLPIILCVSLLNAFSLRDQGYFDVGIGAEKIEDTEISGVTTEYYPGPNVQASVGMAYKNGLGIGLSYQFNYNKVNKAFTKNSVQKNVDDAQEFTNYSASLNFIYKLIPSSEIGFFFSGGPCFVVNSDQKLVSTATAATDSTSSTVVTDGNGNIQTVTTEVVTENEQAADPYEYYDNLSFGYQVGGGLEYRQDKHKSMILQLNYLRSHVYRSTYNAQDPTIIDSSDKDDLEGFYGSFNFRYYM